MMKNCFEAKLFLKVRQQVGDKQDIELLPTFLLASDMSRQKVKYKLGAEDLRAVRRILYYVYVVINDQQQTVFGESMIEGILVSGRIVERERQSL